MKRAAFLAAAALVVAGVVSAVFLFDRLDTSLDPADGSEAKATEAALIQLTGIDGELAALIDGPTGAAEFDHTLRAVRALSGVASAEVVRSKQEPNTVLLVATVRADLGDAQREQLLATFARAVEPLADAARPATIGGSLALDEELGSTAESDLLRADAITIPLILILLGLALGGLRAALLPLTIVVVVLTGALAVLLALTTLTTVSVFAVNVVTLFGIGLAVDYGLLIVSRFREERGQGADVARAVVTTRATAGRAVIYSGLTVATSLSALLVFRAPVVRSLAYGGIAATLLAVGAAHWVLPAMLDRWGHRIRSAVRPELHRGILHRIALWVTGRPTVVAAGTIAVLIVFAFPVGGIAFEGLDARSLPTSSPTRAVSERIAEAFPDLAAAPVIVLADAPLEDPRVSALADQVAATSGARGATVSSLGMHTAIAVRPPGAATDRTAMRLVRDLRDLRAEVGFGVTGEAAEEVDLLDDIRDRLPAALALLVALTLALLTAFTRAPVVALKAIVINAFSVAAAFGLLVWIFQHGHLAGVLGFEATGALHAVILAVTFAFAFGLSMDYEVFLLARIREHYNVTGNNNLAIARGLQQSGRVVTLAAALIIVVFFGFAAGDLLLVKQLGIGLALAVAVDATLVRLLLVPALMALLGPGNWWTPRRERLPVVRRPKHRKPVTTEFYETAAVEGAQP